MAKHTRLLIWRRKRHACSNHALGVFTMVKTYCIGDIHGQAKALKEVLVKCKFDYDEDKLIILGDVCDGGYNTYEVIEELLKIKNKVFVLGNHDEWFIQHISHGFTGEIWVMQGGKATLESYGADVSVRGPGYRGHIVEISWNKDLRIPETHKQFLESHKLYHIEDDMLFVHGGIDPNLPISKQETQTLLWDRQLIVYCLRGNNVPYFKKVFVGHTTTQLYGFTKPIRFSNLIMMDCGGGFDGKLAIMDIETEKYWLSKKQSHQLY